jgi:hypothetical protein
MHLSVFYVPIYLSNYAVSVYDLSAFLRIYVYICVYICMYIGAAGTGAG